MTDILSATAEIRRGKKEEKERKKERRNHRVKIQWSALFHRATITSVFLCTALLTMLPAQLSQRSSSRHTAHRAVNQKQKAG